MMAVFTICVKKFSLTSHTLPYIASIVDDGLATQGATASTVTLFSRNIPISATERWNILQKVHTDVTVTYSNNIAIISSELRTAMYLWVGHCGHSFTM